MVRLRTAGQAGSTIGDSIGPGTADVSERRCFREHWEIGASRRRLATGSEFLPNRHRDGRMGRGAGLRDIAPCGIFSRLYVLVEPFRVYRFTQLLWVFLRRSVRIGAVARRLTEGR